MDTTQLLSSSAGGRASEMLISVTGSSLFAPAKPSQSTPTPANLTGETTASKSASLKTEAVIRPTSKARLDADLLQKLSDHLDTLEGADVEEKILAFEGLRCTLANLWTSCEKAGAFHQHILAQLERSVLSTSSPSPAQVVAFRQAASDLGSPLLTQSHVDTTRSRLIDEGFSPLALLSQLEEEPGEDVRGTAGQNEQH